MTFCVNLDHDWRQKSFPENQTVASLACDLKFVPLPSRTTWLEGPQGSMTGRHHQSWLIIRITEPDFVTVYITEGLYNI